jgi:hypothetical protein
MPAGAKTMSICAGSSVSFLKLCTTPLGTLMNVPGPAWVSSPSGQNVRVPSSM